MLERLSTSLHVALSSHRITLCERHGWPRSTVRVLSDQTWPESFENTSDTVVTRLRETLTGISIASRNVTFMLADDLPRYFIVTPPVNATRLSDCQAAAAMRFQALYGEPSTGWQLAADWDAQHPFVACAIPQPLHDSLLNLASDHRLCLMHIQPAFVAAWNQWRRRLSNDAWFGVVSGQFLTIGMISGQRLCAVRATPISLEVWQDTNCFSEHIAREALLLGLPLPRTLQLCGDVPDDWADRQVGPFAFTRLGDRYDLPSIQAASAKASSASARLKAGT
jgi:hypothetical protein